MEIAYWSLSREEKRMKGEVGRRYNVKMKVKKREEWRFLEEEKEEEDVERRPSERDCGKIERRHEQASAVKREI